MITRQFYKVKQLLDENVRQGEKTELLSADLSQVGKNVELIKTTFMETRKKMKYMLSAMSEDGKKQGKNHKMVLAQTLMEISDRYSKETLLSPILSKSGQVLASLAGELSNYEMIIEEEVFKTINQLLDDLENVEKLKKRLSKARLDLDACRSRYLSAQRQNVSKDKLAIIDTEMNQLISKFENAQDSLSIELLTFISREKEYAMIYVRMLEAEMNHHKNSLDILTRSLPGVQALANSSVFQPVFGISLEQHHKVFNQEVSFVLEECANYIEEVGLELEGIFRLAGSTIRIKRMRAGFDAGVLNLREEEADPFSVAGCMKQYLRELPEPLLTYELENEWIMCSGMDANRRGSGIASLVRKLPRVNYVNLRFLMKFLKLVASHSDKNKMTVSNLAIVIGPNLIWSKCESKQMLCSSAGSLITECMIDNFLTIFQDSIEDRKTVTSTVTSLANSSSASSVNSVQRPPVPPSRTPR